MTARAARARLAIVVSHPIQYQVPLFRQLACSDVVVPEVLFLSRHGVEASYDRGFDRDIRFDVPLTHGYAHRFLRNISPKRAPGHGLTSVVNPGLVGALHRNRVDVLLSHGYAYVSNWLAIAIARARRIPYLLRGESRLDTEADLPTWRVACKRNLVGSLVQNASACLAIGERNRSFYLAYGARPDRVASAPYTVDNDRFSVRGAQGRRDKSTLLGSVGLDARLPTILFAGKLQTWKRPFDVLRAFQDMKTTANLVFVGDGPLRAKIERYTRAHQRLALVGFVNQTEMPMWYGASDVFVLPSDREPWGLAVNEAIASGTVPVVSDSVGCAPDLVGTETGRVYKTGNTKALAAVLDRLLGSGNSLQAARHDGCRRLKYFTLAHTVRGIEEAVSLAVTQNMDV